LGKAGYLPDISGRFNQWTAYANAQLENRNYTGATAGLMNMNALLDEDHRVTVNTKQYDRQMDTGTLYCCNHCEMKVKEKVNEGEEDEHFEYRNVKREVQSSEVVVFDLKTILMEDVLTGRKSNKSWRCIHCKNYNKIVETEIIVPQREQPFYLGIVPEAPRRISGLSNRLGFHDNYLKWFHNFQEELEHSLMIYRVDYIQEHGQDMAEFGLKMDKGDSNASR
jgi:hypothetical protein